jgi:DNA replication protein DnaC
MEVITLSQKEITRYQVIKDTLDRKTSINQAATKGHSLLAEEQIITTVSLQNIEPLCDVTTDIMTYVEKCFANEKEGETIKVVDAIEKNPKFYKLGRLQIIKDVISTFVDKRINRSKRLNITVNWANVVETELGKIPLDYTEMKKQKELKARAEKVEALQEISQSRFSVLIGPAGTGKTKLLNLLCEQNEIENPKVLKLAPTGKARIKLGPEAQTVAQFLYPII